VDKQLIAGVMVAAVAVYLAVHEDVWASSKGSFRRARTTRSLAVGWGDHVPRGEPLRASSSCRAIATAGTSR
jgi:hypothetical protein